jgi:K+-sensing histidine kinase KdpD
MTAFGFSLMIFSIINKHGGHINIQTTGKAGAVFEIYLPATDKNTAHEQIIFDQHINQTMN